MRCSYDHDEARSAQYGQLYNSYAVDDKRGLCPTGWRVPSDEDWQDLEVFLGVSQADVSLEGSRGTDELGCGIKLKAESGWLNDEKGTDDFGFSALPGGFRRYNNGRFSSLGHSGFFWSSTPYGDKGCIRTLHSSWPAEISRLTTVNRRNGYSVRCLRDSE